MQALSNIDRPAEPQLLPVSVKMKIHFAKLPSHACGETRVSLVKAVYDEKRRCSKWTPSRERADEGSLQVGAIIGQTTITTTTTTI